MPDKTSHPLCYHPIERGQSENSSVGYVLVHPLLAMEAMEMVVLELYPPMRTWASLLSSHASDRTFRGFHKVLRSRKMYYFSYFVI